MPPSTRPRFCTRPTRLTDSLRAFVHRGPCVCEGGYCVSCVDPRLGSCSGRLLFSSEKTATAAVSRAVARDGARGFAPIAHTCRGLALLSGEDGARVVCDCDQAIAYRRLRCKRNQGDSLAPARCRPLPPAAAHLGSGRRESSRSGERAVLVEVIESGRRVQGPQMAGHRPCPSRFPPRLTTKSATLRRHHPAR